MSKSTTYLGSMLTLKCPNCHEECIFTNPSTYSSKDFGKVKDTCGNCGTNLKPETGFYFGAAYASYALTVAMWISLLVALNVFDAIGLITFGFLTHPITFLVSGIVLTILLFPYLFRLSRSMWAHFFIKEKAKA